MGSEFRIIGKSVPLMDSKDKVLGRTLFATDFEIAGMLYGKVLRSPYPHARILNIDTSKAERLMGVRGIVTGKDVSRTKFGVAGTPVEDEYLLAIDKVRYIGDEVAAVAAIDEDIAEEALDLIEVEYEPLPAVFDPVEALKPGAPLIHDDKPGNITSKLAYERGNPAEAFAQADYVFQDRFRTSYQHQGYLEPNAAIASWDSSGRVTMWLAVQSPAIARMTYAKALGVRADDIHVIQMPFGGGFGAKLEVKLHPLCALIAKKARRPVRLVNTRREEFIASYPRVPLVMELKIAARRDGSLLGKDMKVIADSGAYANYTPGVMLSAILRHDNLYRLNNIKAEGYSVYTNKMVTGCFRGFGQPQSHFAFEQALDVIASELGVDPLELRLKNASKTGDITPHGWRLESCGLSDCLEKAAELSNWKEKRAQKQPGRGIGVACCMHVSGNRSFLPFFDGSSAHLRISEDGKVKVYTGEVDIGQGARTVFAQIAAEELGAKLEDVEVATVDTDISPHGLGTFGDRATTVGGNGVRAAAIDAKKQVLAIAAEQLEANVDDLEARDSKVNVIGSPDKSITIAEVARIACYRQGGQLIIGKGSYVPTTVSMIDPDSKFGNISVAYPFAAHVVEVEVDTKTGEVKVLNLTAAHDLGKAINPLAAEGQVHGAIAQGLGFGLMEEVVTEQGKVRNASFKRYDMPRTCDMPPISAILVESNDPNGPFGAKGLAEPALIPTAPAIANAIYDAVGVRIKEQPITPDKVLAALKEKAKKSNPLSG